MRGAVQCKISAEADTPVMTTPHSCLYHQLAAETLGILFVDFQFLFSGGLKLQGPHASLRLMLKQIP
jgi:hypothetical protein